MKTQKCIFNDAYVFMTNLLYLFIANCKQSLKVPKGLSENVNTMAKRKKDKLVNNDLQNII